MAYRYQQNSYRRYRRGGGNDNDSYSQPAYSTQINYKQRYEDERPPNKQEYQSERHPIKQEYQSPQQQRYTQQQHQQNQPPPQAPPQQQPPPVPRPQPVQEPPKEPIPMDTAAPTAEPLGEQTNVENGEEKAKPWKRIFQKVPKKVRKKRLNAKLRNLLTPKNAMMVLHELHHDLACVTNEEMTSTGQTSYTVTIDIEGKQYKGQGLSKAAAKQTACENALKAALLDKMMQANVKNASEGSMEEDSGEENKEGIKRRVPAEDDVPWGSLASYALFKLFSEWQSQGYMLPSNSAAVKPFTPTQGATTLQPMKKIPPDANQKHPVQLLNQLKPMCRYTDTREGNPPNTVFTFTVTFDDQSFAGKGLNKKEARKACAKAALISLGIKYED